MVGVIIFGIPKGDDRVKYVQRVESLWDMISNIGGAIAAVANVVLFMAQFREVIEKCPTDQMVGISQRNYDGMIGQLDELKRISLELNLDAALHSIGYCMDLAGRAIKQSDELLALKYGDAERLENALEAVRTNFLIQMNSKLVLVFDSGHAEYLQSSEPPFGRAVDDAFPKAAGEISEAALCLAFQRPTATVFHLMRAVELAVQRLADTLGVTKIEKEWGKLLADIGGAIEAMPKGKERNTWSSIHSHLYHVKQSWRNDTMHPKTTYTEAEAEAVFAAVKTFMVELIPMLATD